MQGQDCLVYTNTQHKHTHEKILIVIRMALYPVQLNYFQLNQRNIRLKYSMKICKYADLEDEPRLDLWRQLLKAFNTTSISIRVYL